MGLVAWMRQDWRGRAPGCMREFQGPMGRLTRAEFGGGKNALRVARRDGGRGAAGRPRSFWCATGAVGKEHDRLGRVVGGPKRVLSCRRGEFAPGAMRWMTGAHRLVSARAGGAGVPGGRHTLRTPSRRPLCRRAKPAGRARARVPPWCRGRDRPRGPSWHTPPECGWPCGVPSSGRAKHHTSPRA